MEDGGFTGTGIKNAPDAATQDSQATPVQGDSLADPLVDPLSDSLADPLAGGAEVQASGGGPSAPADGPPSVLSDVRAAVVQRNCEGGRSANLVDYDMGQVENTINGNIESWRTNLERATGDAVDHVFAAEEKMMKFKHAVGDAIIAAASFDLSKIVTLASSGDSDTSGDGTIALGSKATLNVGALVSAGTSALVDAVKKTQVKQLEKAKTDVKKAASAELVTYVGKWRKDASAWARRQMLSKKVEKPADPARPEVCQETTVDVRAAASRQFPPLEDASQLSGIKARAQQIVDQARGMVGPPPEEMKSGATKHIEGHRERIGRERSRSDSSELIGPDKSAGGPANPRMAAGGGRGRGADKSAGVSGGPGSKDAGVYLPDLDRSRKDAVRSRGGEARQRALEEERERARREERD